MTRFSVLQRHVQQTTPSRQLTVAYMPQNEYDDSNAAARPRFRPPACVTHLHTPPRFLQAWRGLLLPGPIPGVAKVHHRSLSPSQRLSPDPAVAPPTLGPCLSPSPRRSREGDQIPSPLRGEGEDEGETPAPRRREECNQMQLNATDLKVCHSWPLVTRPTRAGWPNA